ncbi:MAG: NAD(P)H-dependent oxidoreductase [Candidatus Omnitrophica bacterium]|nr:NAD(P)H-dependent oxidoreductase [Candidatus Omnitrophota bacterium]
MKHLIVYCHPNPKSFNHAVKETFVLALKQKGQDVRVRDLYDLNFDPVLKGSDFAAFQEGNVPEDIRREQEQIRWADVITFIFPIWWTGMPARMKGYIDRVFSHGFAYVMDEKGLRGLLGSKKMIIFNTCGTPEDVYIRSGMRKSIEQIFQEGIFGFCGMKVIGHKFFGAVPTVSNDERAKMLEEVKRIASKMI